MSSTPQDHEETPSTPAAPTPEDAAAIQEISNLRQDLLRVKQRAELFRATEASKKCGRELALLITEVQSARHWGGECLSHFPTGYVVTDQPDKPETHSQAQ